jgi:hypothetical protein
MRPADVYQGVDESLQADVMRFMAIIAFCLIAILALVRSVEPAEPVAAEPVARQPTSPPPIPQPPPKLDLLPPRTTMEAPDVPAVARSEVPPVPPPISGARPDPPAAATPTAEPAPPLPAAPRQPGLSLRFASDQDFLRLVTRGGIQVFAFRDGEVLSVSADFRFEPAPAPARLHELLPETIPELMSTALRKAMGGDGYRWGIAMPERMARQIRGHVDRGASGALIIDRYGEVRHHDS